MRSDIAGGKVIFLAGAGISMIPPSAFPSGFALKDLAVEALCTTRDLRRALNRARRNPRYATITPEIVFQRFHASLAQGSIRPFFNIFNCGVPNDVHKALAGFARAGSVLYTTNFDMLFEAAGAPRKRVEHLHGAVSRPASLVARIHQVRLGLPHKVEADFKRRLAGRTLCVLGYSGNDEEVRRAVTSSGLKRILWLTRDSNDWAWTNVPRYADRHPVQVANGDLCSLLTVSPASTLSISVNRQNVETRQRIIAEWAQGTRLVDRYACISELMFELDDFRGAYSISKRALEIARGTELAGWFRIQMADALKIMGQFAKAERLVRQAIRINNRLNDPYEIAGAYNNFGVFLTEKERPEPRRALPLLQRAVDACESVDLRKVDARRREGLKLVRGRALNNLGLTHETLRNYEIALDFYRKSLAAKCNVGDVLGEAKTLGNICIVEAIMNDPNAAESRERAFALMDKYELWSQKAYVLRRLGKFACDQERTVDGRRLLKEALDLYRSIGAMDFDKKLTEAALRGCC
jgi:tetratricopeptide (TPR) repeat protein